MTGPSSPISNKDQAIMVRATYRATHGSALRWLFQSRVEKGPGIEANRRAFSLVSDQNSGINQIVFAMAPFSSDAPLSQLSFNSVARSFVLFSDWVNMFVPYVQSLRKDFHSTFWSDRTLRVSQLTSYYAYSVCGTINLIGNVINNFGRTFITPATSAAFNAVGKVGSVLLVATSVFRGIRKIKEVRQTAQVQSLLGKAVNLKDKISTIKKLWQVTDDEALKGIPVASREAYLTNYFNQHIKTKLKESLDALGESTVPMNETALKEALNNPDFKAFVMDKLKIDAKVGASLSGVALLGLVMKKSKLALSKQEAFLNKVTESNKDKVQIREMIKTTLKMDRVAGAVLKTMGPQAPDAAAEALFKKLESSMNRKQFKNVALIVSSVLTIVACVVTMACPPALVGALAAVIAIWIISNTIEYFVSLDEMREVANQDILFENDKKRMWISLGISMIAMALMIGLMCTPVGQAAGLAIIAGSFIALGFYLCINAALLHRDGRRVIGWLAEKTDSYFHQKIASLIGAPIEAKESEKRFIEQAERLRIGKIKAKVMSLNSSERESFLRAVFNIEPSSLKMTRTIGLRTVIKNFNELNELQKQLVVERELQQQIDAFLLRNENAASSSDKLRVLEDLNRFEKEYRILKREKIASQMEGLRLARPSGPVQIT